ncbi:hypothetical protein B6S59_25330 [Pseudomonas sp. A46]|nr:hypothetical protein [Pseudomonas sp. A46]OWJ91097.1 hypothetical protein B6S59_25330 [Pseudomonas sp. A46]
MQGEDDRLVRLVEMLHDERDELPKAEGAAAQAGIRVKGANSNINFGTQLNIGNVADREPLSPEQLDRLKLLVSNISKEFKVDPWTLTREVLNTRIGVSKIEEIPRSRFTEAEESLKAHAEQLHAHHHARRLMAETLELANDKGVYQDLMRYCSRQFGTTFLSRLSPDQLKAALAFVEGQQPPAAGQQRPDAPSDPRPSAMPASTQKHWEEYKALVMQHPWQFGWTCVAGAFIGKVFL